MSNKEKYVNTIALLIQSRSPTPRKAHDKALKSFERNMTDMPEIPCEALQEAVAFLIGATGCLRDVLAPEASWFVATIMDDIVTHLHPYICEMCRKGQKHDVEDTREEEEETQSPFAAMMERMGVVPIAAGTAEEMIEKLQGIKDGEKKKN